MAVTTDKAAPYAPASAVIGIIERHRHKGLPMPVDAGVLQRSGVPDSLIPRTLQALQALDLIDEQGRATEIFERIRLASENEYKERLKEWLNTAYADVLMFIDPARDGETAARDAFRSYKPIGQQPRMVTLFLGLFAAAGVAPAERLTKSRTSRVAQPQAQTRPKTSPRPLGSGRPTKRADQTEIPAPISGLLTGLPEKGGSWSKAQRDKFLETFGAVLDYCFAVVESDHAVAENEEEST